MTGLTFKEANVGLICTADAIVPTLGLYASGKLKSKNTQIQSLMEMGIWSKKSLIDQAIDKCLGDNDFQDKKVVIKGCGSVTNIEYAYTTITDRLLPLVNSLMFGEPCSTVPIFKRKKIISGFRIIKIPDWKVSTS